MPGYSRDQLLDVRRILRAEANAGSLGISSVAAPSTGEVRTVTVVKKKVRAASAGDAIKSTSSTTAPAPSMNIWEQRRLAAANKKPEETKPAVVSSSSTAILSSSTTAPATDGFTVTSSSSGSMSLAEQYLQADAKSSFSADERAKLAQLREHLKNRTLASQLRPIATEFRPTSAQQQKHWSREWNKPVDGENTPAAASSTTPVKSAAPLVEKKAKSAAVVEEPAAPSGPKSWSQIVNPNPRAKTAEPASRVEKKVKVQQVEAAAPVNEDDMRMTVQAVDPVATQRVLGKIRTASSRHQADASRSPSKRRVPPPRTIGQLRQSSTEDLPVDFRDLIPTTDVTGKCKPINWKIQREKMRSVANILLERNEKRKQEIAAAKSAAKSRAASGNAIDAINARATAPVKKPKGRPPTFREHVATRARSAIVRPVPVPRMSRRAQSRSGVPKQQEAVKEATPEEKAQAETRRRQQMMKQKPTSWENYIPDLKEFPEDYAALFADWSYNDQVTESKLQRVTDDVKLMQEFAPHHVELLMDPETGVQEEYTMMWVEGIYRRIPVSVVTPELIRRSKEAEKIYSGIDNENMSPKRAASLQKRKAPVERKERKSRRETEVAEIRRKIERTLEAGLDACDRKAADAVPLAAVMQDKQFQDLTLKQKCEICRARRVRFLKSERLVMVERVASQQNLQVLDVIAVLHAMMSDRIEYKARRKNEIDEMKFARMLAKRDQQMNKLQEAAQKKESEVASVAAAVTSTPKKNNKAAAAPTSSHQTGVVVQPLQESEEELRKRVAARKKHLQIAQRTPGYQIWLKLKDSKDPKYKVKYPVTTPVPEQLCSKRAWDGLVRQWRQRLHQYDQFAPEILGRPVYDRDEVAAHRASTTTAKSTPIKDGQTTPPLAVESAAADDLLNNGKTAIEVPATTDAIDAATA